MIITLLDDVFTKFDTMAEKHGLEKIKTIGDCYMAVAGLPDKRVDHAHVAAAMALDIQRSMKGYTTPDGQPVQFRIGLDAGPVVAGVIGKKKFIYDLWGDAVNTASRMESSGLAGEIHCTDSFKNSLPPDYVFTSRGMMDIKSKGQMQTWLLTGHK
jgi:class 3 adenylate cyclase